MPLAVRCLSGAVDLWRVHVGRSGRRAIGHAKAENEMAESARVLCWTLGSHLGNAHWDRASQISSALRRTNPLAPPLIAQPDEAFGKYGQILDMIRLPTGGFATSASLLETREDLKRRINNARRGIFTLAEIPTQLDYALERQQALITYVQFFKQVSCRDGTLFAEGGTLLLGDSPTSLSH